MASRVSNVQVTINRPSQPSRRVSPHRGSCAAFRSQIRSQQSKQQVQPPRREISSALLVAYTVALRREGRYREADELLGQASQSDPFDADIELTHCRYSWISSSHGRCGWRSSHCCVGHGDRFDRHPYRRRGRPKRSRGFRPPYGRPTAPPPATRTRTGFTRSARARPGWDRASSVPRGRRCQRDRSVVHRDRIGPNQT
jgi:hypothetical protein